MSHGNIYQLATKPISEDDYVSPEDFCENHDAYADYLGDRVEGEEKEKAIGYLADVLKDRLTYTGNGIFVYKGLGDYLQKWVDAIHEKAEAITVDNVLNYLPRAELRDILIGTHKDSVDRFVIEEYSGRFAQPMSDLIEFMKSMKPGDLLYVGAVIDFHY